MALQQGARIGLPMVLKLYKNKVVQQGLAGLGLLPKGRVFLMCDQGPITI